MVTQIFDEKIVCLIVAWFKFLYYLFYGSLRGVILTQTFFFFIDLKLQQLKSLIFLHFHTKFIIYNIILHYYDFLYILFLYYIIESLLFLNLLTQPGIIEEGDTNKLLKLFKFDYNSKYFNNRD